MASRPTTMARQIRFRPPRTHLGPDVVWVFIRAFGPVGAATPAPTDTVRVLEMAQRFDLSPRIAARHDFEILAHEVGREAATELFALRAATKAEGVRFERTGVLLAEISDRLSLPMAFLKYQALREIGALLDGSRGAYDVDVLVPGTRAGELAARLEDAGYEAFDYPESEHHLSTMTHPAHGPVEIHRLMPGVRLPGEDSLATFDDLQRAGLLHALSRFPGKCFTPDRPLLVAHAVVHGIAQHGARPTAYQMTKMLGDLIDLGICDSDGPALAEAAYPMISRAVSRPEMDAVHGLCRRLSSGDLDLEHDGASPAGDVELLHHVVAGELDPAYVDSLNLVVYSRGLSDRPRPAALASRLWRTLFPSATELDATYGPSESWPGRLGKRLLRLSDLAVRTVRYGSRYVALRLGDRHPPKAADGRAPDRGRD